MLADLVKQLEDGLPEVLEIWVRQYLHTSHLALQDISRHEANALFLQLIKVVGTKLCTLDERGGATRFSEAETSALVKSLTDITAKGADVVQVVHCIKMMRVALEQYTRGVAASENHKSLMLNLLHCVTDCLEITMITRWQAAKNRDEGAIEPQIVIGPSTYKCIFESTSNLVLITDEAGLILEVNPIVHIAFSGERLAGRFCGELLQIEGELESILSMYPPDTNNELTIEVAGIRKTYNLQIRLLSRLYPLARGFLFILNDITCAVDHRQLLEQRVKERTRALAKSEKLLDSIFQSVGKGILLLDSELEVVQANRMASEMYGVPLEVLIGSYYQSITDEQGFLVMSKTCRELEEGEVLRVESQSLYVDGRKFPALITVTSMTLDNRTFWPLIVSDITQQKKLETRIVEQKQHAEEMNLTLRNVLKSIEKEKKEFEENLSLRIRNSLLPTLSRIRNERDDEWRSGYLSMLEEQMISLTEDFSQALDGDLLRLSKTELRICRFVKAGLTGKEICDTLNLSFETIQTHRKNIRKKLGLRGKEINLHTFLADRGL